MSQQNFSLPIPFKKFLHYDCVYAKFISIITPTDTHGQSNAINVVVLYDSPQ